MYADVEIPNGSHLLQRTKLTYTVVVFCSPCGSKRRNLGSFKGFALIVCFTCKETIYFQANIANLEQGLLPPHHLDPAHQTLPQCNLLSAAAMF